MAQTNPLQLDRVHNEGMRVIVGTIKDTPTETMRFMLDLPPMQIRKWSTSNNTSALSKIPTTHSTKP